MSLVEINISTICLQTYNIHLTYLDLLNVKVVQLNPKGRKFDGLRTFSTYLDKVFFNILLFCLI